jgi:hypothetical protein
MAGLGSASAVWVGLAGCAAGVGALRVQAVNAAASAATAANSRNA